uniref:Retrotransposon protein, putative, Ty3-gypsy subclass n=1 Tax=Oryza sativa subsp. japonica TaxID=39947 RepID=Q2QU17_ORYSJ|nr:retrotransposon protein, putative, Ty3-gypsy subclass [Oryza sativa Japonica Group]
MDEIGENCQSLESTGFPSQGRSDRSFAPIQYAYNAIGGSTGVYTADYTGISYMQNRADNMTGRDTGLTACFAGQTVPTMAGQTVYYAGQTVPTIAGQTVPYSGQIGPPVAGLTAPLTTGQTGPWAGQTGSLGISPGFHTTTSSTDFNYYLSPVNTVSHAIPHIPNAYNDINRGYPPDTRYGQYNNIMPQQPPFRPPSPPPDPPKPETVEDWFRNTIRENFAKLWNRAREYQKPYPDFYDIIPYLRGYKIPEFTKFSGEDSGTTWEHVDQFLAQCGEANWDTYCLASLDNDATTIMAEPSDGLDCVISLDNDGIAEPSDGSDYVSSLDNDIIENIAELSDCSDYITSESEIALSPKTESQIGHVDVGKDNDNVLRDSSEIESKIVMHTYQRPYPEHVDSVPYPQGFEVPNFTKFTCEDARTTMEHIGQFIDQCGKVGSNDLLKLKLFPLSLSNFASTWYSLLAPNSISTWSQMEREFHDYFKGASLMEQRPIDTSSVTCETISVTSMPKTGIVSNPLPVSSIDVAKKKGKSVIIGDPRPKNRIKNVKAEDHRVAKDESSSSQKTKKPKLTFEMLMAKYKKGLACQRFDNQTSGSKRPRSSRRERFGQTPKQSEPSTIPTPYKPLVVMPWYPHPMSPFGYPFMYYMPWMPQPPMPCHQGWKESPRSVPNHSSNSRQDRFPQKNRSGGSKVKKVKKVWVRKEAKAPEVVAINEESQDVHVPTGDAAKTIQAEKTEANAVAVDIGGLTETAGQSDCQTTAGLTDPIGRSDRQLVAGLTGPRGRSDRGALEKSGKIESNIGASTSTKNMKNHCLAPGKQPQPKWIPSGLSRSQKRRL